MAFLHLYSSKEKKNNVNWYSKRNKKTTKNRVGLTPAGVHSLVGKGHQVLVETNAGLGSGFADEDYSKQGATIVATAAEAWAAELVVRSKNPR